jgi:hypothetical protein
MQEACDAREPPPPVYSLDNIVEMTDKDPYRIAALANGFIVVGGCPNGDLIAVDVANEPGSIWYICHETMTDGPLREMSVRVAKDLAEMLEGMAEGNFPFDFFQAKSLQKMPMASSRRIFNSERDVSR